MSTRLYPVQEFLVGMQAAGADWILGAGLLGDALRRRGKEGPFHLFHFDVGRRAGKTTMFQAMVEREILGFRDGSYRFPGEDPNDPRKSFVNIVYSTGTDRQMQYFKKLLKEGELGPAFIDRGSWLEVPMGNGASVHVHFAFNKVPSFGLEHIILHCIDDPLGFIPVESVRWNSRARIVVMGEENPESPLPTGATNAVSLVIPPEIVNPALMISKEMMSSWVK